MLCCLVILGEKRSSQFKKKFALTITLLFGSFGWLLWEQMKHAN